MVGYGSFATRSSQRQVWPCPLRRRKRKYIQSISGSATDHCGLMYRARNLVERFFNKVKQSRRIATRQTRSNYLAFTPAHLDSNLGIASSQSSSTGPAPSPQLPTLRASCRCWQQQGGLPIRAEAGRSQQTNYSRVDFPLDRTCASSSWKACPSPSPASQIPRSR